MKRLIIAILLLCGIALPQTYTLSPVPKMQFFTASGAVLAGGKIYTYQAGTTTPLATYADSSGTPNANPVVLDSGGFATIYLSSQYSYKFVAQDSTGVQQWSQDNISSPQPLSGIKNATFFTGADIGAQINAAIAACPNNCVIVVPPGTYSQATTINLNQMDVHLLCLGGQVSQNENNSSGTCRLNWTGAAAGTMLNVGSTTFTVALGGIGVDGFTLNCASTAGVGLKVYSTRSSSFTNIDVFGCTQFGIDEGINANADSAGSDQAKNWWENVNSFSNSSGAPGWRVGASGSVVDVSGNRRSNVSSQGVNADGLLIESSDNDRWDGTFSASGTGKSIHLTCQSGATSNDLCARELQFYDANVGNGGMQQDGVSTFYPTSNYFYGFELCNGTNILPSTTPGSASYVKNGSATFDLLDCGDVYVGKLTFGVGAAGASVQSSYLNYESGKFTTLGTLATVGNGTPIEVAKVALTNQSANISATTAYAVPSGGAGWYRVHCSVVETSADAASSTLPQCQILWNEQDSAVTQVAMGVTTTNAANTVGASGLKADEVNHIFYFGNISVPVAASTNIQYQTVGYASNTAGSMKYALRVWVEYLGN